VYWSPAVWVVKTYGDWFQFSGLALQETSQSSWRQIPWRCFVKNVTKPGRMPCRGEYVTKSLLCPQVQVLLVPCGRKVLARTIESALLKLEVKVLIFLWLAG